MKGKWEKGKSGNPKGRPANFPPELRHEIDQNKEALKRLILKYLSLTENETLSRMSHPDSQNIEIMISQVMFKIKEDGDMAKLKMLLEVVFGKLPEDKDPFEMTAEEKLLVMTYRKRREDEQQSLTTSSPSP